jgi:hypothetical protein
MPSNIDYVIRTSLPALIYFIIFVKVIFVISSIVHLTLPNSKGGRLSSEKKEQIDSTAVLVQEYTEFVFIVATSILLVVIFSPWHDNISYLTTKVKFLFYLFGIILIFTADWDMFFDNSRLLGAAIGF